MVELVVYMVNFHTDKFCAFKVSRFGNQLFEFRLGQKTIVALRLALESLKRISEYSEDIAEMAINLTARRQDLYPAL